MPVDPESFRGKLSLLIVDKLVIGAIIACTFAAYDWWKTKEAERHAAEAAAIQLEFERAKLIKEFLPVIVDDKLDPMTRGYTLRAAVVTGSMDAETAVELARSLVPAGLEDWQFRRVLAPAMPAGIPALCRHAVEMSASWRAATGQSFTPTTSFDPVSGRESIPEELRGPIHEARLWRTVILDSLPRMEESEDPLDKTHDISVHLYGLFLLLQPGSQLEAFDLSQSRSRGVRLVGNLSRALFDSGDGTAVASIQSELLPNPSSPEAALDGIGVSSAILVILQEFGPPHAGPIAEPIARILTSSSPWENPRIKEAHYWLRWRAADVLEAMNRRMAELAGRVGWKALIPLSGARAAETTLVAFLQQFHHRAANANNDAQLEKLTSEYESGKLVRRVVSIAGGLRTSQAQNAIVKLRSLGPDKLRHFPLLEEEIDRALSEAETRRITPASTGRQRSAPPPVRP